nr:creatininase family protein [bacterium]
MKKYYQPELVARHVPREALPETVEAKYMRPGELLAMLDKAPIAYLPVGTIEWHGRQNPLGCDAIKVERLLIEVAKRMGGVVMPALYFGTDSFWDCGHGIGNGMDSVAGFKLPGSYYRIPDQLFYDLLHAACANYLDRGFKRVIMASGHNASIQGQIMQAVAHDFQNEEGVGPVFAMMEFDTMEKGPLRDKTGDHAGGYETSMMMYLAGERVNMAANEGQEIPALASSNAFPLAQASAKMGEERFIQQVEGTCRLVEGMLRELGL